MSHKTHTIDAANRILGRLAAEVAILLQGKHKPNYAPNLDTGEEIVIINTSRIKISGKKDKQKKYYRHSGYIGSLKEKTYEEVFNKNPNEVLTRAIYGMLPRNKLRAKMMKRLKLYINEIKK